MVARHTVKLQGAIKIYRNHIVISVGWFLPIKDKRQTKMLKYLQFKWYVLTTLNMNNKAKHFHIKISYPTRPPSQRFRN